MRRSWDAPSIATTTAAATMKRPRDNRSRAEKSLQEQFSNCIKATLETWVHQALYRRRVYPSSAFCNIMVWGARCQACRVKDVVVYVRDSIEMGLLALEKKAATRLSLVIVEESFDDENGNDDNDGDEEEYDFDFEKILQAKKTAAKAQEQPTPTQVTEKERLTLAFDRVQAVQNVQDLRHTERVMRDLIIRTQSIPEPRTVKITNNTSFRLVWHLDEGATDEAKYGDFVQGFNEGKVVEDELSFQRQQRKGRVRRPLHHASSNALRINFYSQVVTAPPPPTTTTTTNKRKDPPTTTTTTSKLKDPPPQPPDNVAAVAVAGNKNGDDGETMDWE